MAFNDIILRQILLYQKRLNADTYTFFFYFPPLVFSREEEKETRFLTLEEHFKFDSSPGKRQPAPGKVT